MFLYTSNIAYANRKLFYTYSLSCHAVSVLHSDVRHSSEMRHLNIYLLYIYKIISLVLPILITIDS